MSVGLLRGTVALEKHNPEWEMIGKQTIKQLNDILFGVAIDIQHVGSTAINGIVAKPIIDLVIGVSDFNDILSLNNELEKAGFLFRGQDHPQQYLYICGSGDFITHHIHVVIYNSKEWNDYINLRDYLNAYIDEAQEYSLLKETLAKQYANDRKTYTAKKSNFINSLLIKAQAWRNKTKE